MVKKPPTIIMKAVRTIAAETPEDNFVRRRRYSAGLMSSRFQSRAIKIIKDKDGKSQKAENIKIKARAIIIEV